jgi:hypothetical protein
MQVRRTASPGRGLCYTVSMPSIRIAAILALVAALHPTLSGQSTEAWIRPYDDAPLYWELIGDPNLPRTVAQPLFAGPQVRAVSLVRVSVQTGDIIASVVQYNFVLGQAGLLIGSTVSDLAEVRFVGADAAGVTLEVRQVDPVPSFSTELHQCMKERATSYAHRLDARWQAVAGCWTHVRWKPWQQLRFPLRGSYVAPGGLPLVFEFTDKGVLEVSVNQR